MLILNLIDIYEVLVNFDGYFNNLTVTPIYPNDAQWKVEVDGGSTNANQMLWHTLIWDSGTLPTGTTATFKGRSCSGSGGTGNCGTWESSSLSVGGILTFTGTVSNERYLQVQADLASDTTRQSTPTVGQVDLTYQITSTLPSVKYYYFGSQRVAMRQGNEVYYLHGDHLGSTSLTTNLTGTVVAETRHHPFGEVRWESGSSVTDFGFTGQRNEVSFGLMDYNARFYSPGLGRFVSADTVVPDPMNPQLFNRYSYAGNNPVRYNDPDGHCGPLCSDFAIDFAKGASLAITPTKSSEPTPTIPPTTRPDLYQQSATVDSSNRVYVYAFKSYQNFNGTSNGFINTSLTSVAPDESLMYVQIVPLVWDIGACNGVHQPDPTCNGSNQSVKERPKDGDLNFAPNDINPTTPLTAFEYTMPVNLYGGTAVIQFTFQFEGDVEPQTVYLAIPPSTDPDSPGYATESCWTFGPGGTGCPR